ncbi:MAG TPA: hypothetical protein VKB86_14405 [Pyrinomonadaceae bacterium]|nr:hypothetical protein [Pyrinomonadaceae bacterium]
MSTEKDQARAIAERIARRVSEGREDGSVRRVESAGDVSSELAAMRASLEELQRKLVQIESHITGGSGGAASSRNARANEQERTDSQSHSPSVGVRSPWLSGMYVPAAHPSQERFGVEEAAVSELVDFFESEKKCELDPSGKPCDHCAMCSSRGF